MAVEQPPSRGRVGRIFHWKGAIVQMHGMIHAAGVRQFHEHLIPTLEIERAQVARKDQPLISFSSPTASGSVRTGGKASAASKRGDPPLVFAMHDE